MPKHKIQNVPKTSSPQMQFAEHARFYGHAVPGSKYETDKCFGLTKPKIYKLKIVPDKSEPKNKYKITKSKLPDCGSY